MIMISDYLEKSSHLLLTFFQIKLLTNSVLLGIEPDKFKFLKIFDATTNTKQIQGAKYGIILNSLDNIADLTY